MKNRILSTLEVLIRKNPSIFISLFWICLFFFFFSYSLTVTWDSGHYMSLVKILYDDIPFSSWDIARGPIFPILILFANIIFGKTASGLLMFNFLLYVGLLVPLFLLLKEVLGLKEKKEWVTAGWILLFSIINPVIFGYYHTLLTESVAITFAVITCYLSIKFLRVEFKAKDYSSWLFPLIFSGLTIFSWFLKQPYVSITLFPLLITTLISIVDKFDIRNIIYRLSVLIACILSLIISISIWNSVLAKHSIDLNTDRNVTSILGNLIVDGADNINIVMDREAYTKDNITNNKFLSREEKEILIENDFQGYYIVDILKGENNKIGSDLIKENNGNISTIDAVGFLLSSTIKYPLSVIDSYYANYMAVIDVYESYTPDGVKWYTSREFNWEYMNENRTIASRIFFEGENIFYMPTEYLENVESFRQVNKPPIILNIIMKYLVVLFNYFMKVSFLLLPISFICSLCLKIWMPVKEKNRKLLNSVVILLGFSLLHIFSNILLGAIIDRYISPAIITSFVGNILLIYLIYRIILEKKSKDVKRK